MPAPPAYTDEDVPLSVAQGLRDRDFTVTTSLEMGVLGNSDEAQLLRASESGCVVLSHNRRHFRRVHTRFIRRGQTHGGIVLIPQDTSIERLVVRAAIMLTWIAALPTYQATLFQWNDCQQALIHGYLPPGFTEDEVRLALGWASPE